MSSQKKKDTKMRIRAFPVSLLCCVLTIALNYCKNSNENCYGSVIILIVHECFLNSDCSVKRAVRVAWELTRVFLLFSISLFLLVASTLLFLRFLTLVKLLTVRVITPTVTCRWYVIIFSFFLLLLIMANDLDIACFWFFLSVRQMLRNILLSLL